MPRSKPVEREKLTPAQALEIYASYHNRCAEWNQLSSFERSKVLRIIYSNCKGIECLTPGCPTRLTTYNGMLYHLEHCGVTAKERLKPCPICNEQFKSGEMRAHLQMHSIMDDQQGREVNEEYLSNFDDITDRRKRKRKSALKANESFARIAADLTGADDVEKTPSKKEVRKKIVKVECSGLDASDEDDEPDSSYDPLDEMYERAVINGKPKKHCVDNTKRHKRYTVLPEAARILWENHVSKAYNRIIADDYLKIGFEEWIIEFTSWMPLPESDIEPYVAHYKDKSVLFNLKNSTEPTSLKLLDSMTTNSGAIGFCGSAIAACAWCPIPSKENIQYIAVSTHTDANLSPVLGERAGSLQLWACTFESGKCVSLDLELVLAHDYGVTMDIKWCPSGIWQPAEREDSNLVYSLPRLGALATTSGTGEIPIFGIPQPLSLRTGEVKSDAVKVYKVQPLIVLYCGASLVSYSLDWSHFNGHDKLAAGFHDGSASVWNLKKPCELLRDTSNRLLAVTTIPAFKSPVRCLRWYSSTKILLCSMDRKFSLWDIEDTVCLWTQSPQQFVLAVGCGPVFPGYVICRESSSSLPPYLTYTDAPTQACLVLNRYHQSTVWATDTSPWNGCVLGVDNQGYVSLSCIKSVPSEDGLKRKFTETLLMTTVYPSQADKTFCPYTYEEAKNCVLSFNFDVKEVKRNHLENEFKRLELTGQYPLAALFAVCWNPNKSYSRWCCFGGQTGLLFVSDTKT